MNTQRSIGGSAERQSDVDAGRERLHKGAHGMDRLHEQAALRRRLVGQRGVDTGRRAAPD